MTFHNVTILIMSVVNKNKNKCYYNIFLEKGSYKGSSQDFLGYVHIKKVLVSNKIYFDEKNCKYFIGYLYNDKKVKPLNLMLPKISAYVKSYDGQSKWMFFLLKMMPY